MRSSRYGIQILPSVLAADFSRLEPELRSVEEGGIDILHLDVMDGQFVPNLTFGPLLVKAIDKLSEKTLDVHLMVNEPAYLIPPFRKAGADWITIHTEACDDVAETLKAIRDSGALAGLAINPETPLSDAIPYFSDIHLMLLMTVSPGFGGQSFRAEVIPKIEQAELIREREGHDFVIEVDGGIGMETAGRVVDAGAELLVAGSAVFDQDDRPTAIRALLDRAVASQS